MHIPDARAAHSVSRLHYRFVTAFARLLQLAREAPTRVASHRVLVISAAHTTRPARSGHIPSHTHPSRRAFRCIRGPRGLIPADSGHIPVTHGLTPAPSRCIRRASDFI